MAKVSFDQGRASTGTQIRAVLFDFGGTLTVSISEQIAQRVAAAGLVAADVARVMTAAVADVNDDDSVAHRCERGEVPLSELLAWADDQLPGLGRLLDPDGDFLFGDKPVMNDAMMSLCEDARGSGLKTGILSNQFSGWAEHLEARARGIIDLDLFDAVLISCRLGVRKPNPEAYLLACEALGVAPSEVLYLDDSVDFVAAATATGLTAVHVDSHADAAREARGLLGLLG